MRESSMQARLDQLLSHAVDAWCNSAAWSVFLGNWRGRNDLVAHATAYPEPDSANDEPNCVVIAEYARLALASGGSDARIDLLRRQCHRVLQSTAPGQRNPKGGAAPLVRALTHGVLAAVEYRANQTELACGHLQQAGTWYDSAWLIGQQRIGSHDSVPNSGIGEDLTMGEPALRLLDLAHRRGFFGSAGITTPTWLTLRRLLSHVLGTPDAPVICGNQLKGLTVRGDQVGHVLHLGIDKLEWPPALPAQPERSLAFLDPLSFGITTLDKRMRFSIWLAARCCRQSPAWSQDVALRIRCEDPGLVPRIAGASAGALLAAGLIATLEEQRLDASKSTTSMLTIKRSALESIPELDRESTRLSADDLELKPIRGVVNKLAEAWQASHGIDEFFLHPRNEEQWRRAHPDCEHPRITAVDSLAALRDGLWGERRLERELERHAKAVHGFWDRARQAETDGRESLEHDHRFDCYIPPTFRVEGDLKPPRHGDAAIDAHEAMRPLAGEESEREEAPVPGEGDEQLLHLLELSLRGRRWADAPEWLKAGRNLVMYDVAGAGKTVCSYRLAHHLTDSEVFPRLYGHRDAPLVIRLDGRWRRDRDGRLLSLRESLETVFAEQARRTSPDDNPLVQQTIDYALRRNRVVVILDGFDQFKPDERQKVVDSVGQDVDGGQCRWIVTSRVHAIDDLRGQNKFFLDRHWTRVRIDPFSAEQQDDYFELGFSGGEPIGERWWGVLADREAMSDLLGLPMVLWMIRVLIEEADRKQQPLPVFRSLSQLYLVTSRKLLARALELNQDEVNERLVQKQIRLPDFRDAAERLEVLEHVLTLFAFQMMLIEEFNGRLEGNALVARFEELCRSRYLRPNKERFDVADPFDRDDIQKEREREVIRWKWALEVLRTIELSHRSVTEAYGESQIVFRSRKMLECHAARYLTRYATAWDIYAENRVEEMPVVDRELQSRDLSRLCAWNNTTHPEWEETWKLAIDMPMEPIATTDQDGTIRGAVLDHGVTCQSLSALFRQPKAYPGREVRPTRLMYLAWHLFELDDQLLRERQFMHAGDVVRGEVLDAATRRGLGEQLLLGVRVHSATVVQERLRVLEEFRATSRPLVAEFERRWDTILVDSATGRRELLSADNGVRAKQLARWQQQSSQEKSHSFLQCPPKEWLAAFQAGRLAQDPRMNPAIEGHETERFSPLFVQATTVTRAQYREFDPAFEAWEQVADDIQKFASAFDEHSHDDAFPIICIDWFDAWVFCKWLGAGYRLPTEWQWEHAARAGSRTEYHFGDGLNGSQANCDGNYPHGVDAQGHQLDAGPYLKRTTPVGCVTYPCSPWGLWDVHGNVWEWCANWYDEDESSRSLRGGSWFYSAILCRSADRYHFDPHFRYDVIGFRLCRE